MLRLKLGHAAALVLFGGLMLASAPTSAQTPPRSPGDRQMSEPGRGDTVESRARPEYDAQGIRLGGFFLYPKLGASESYRDNVFYEDTNKNSDLETVVSPSLRLNSNWNNHKLDLFANADLGRFLNETAANYTDARAGFDGRLDIRRDMNLAGGATFARLHEDRSSPDQGSAEEPTIYRRYGPNLKFTKRFNRIETQLGGSYDVYSYDNVTTPSGGVINNHDRNRREATGTVRLGYDIQPRYQVFVRGTVNNRNYVDAVDDNGLNRDSQGWETVGGLAFDLTGVTRGNVFAGYMAQHFDDPALETVKGPSFGGDLTWNATRLTTVKGKLTRQVQETTLNGASGALATNGRLSVDHELLRNVILSADGGYSHVNYKDISRKDDIYDAGVGGKYLVNEYAHLQLRLSHTTRDSNAANADYDSNVIMFRLVAQR